VFILIQKNLHPKWAAMKAHTDGTSCFWRDNSEQGFSIFRHVRAKMWKQSFYWTFGDEVMEGVSSITLHLPLHFLAMGLSPLPPAAMPLCLKCFYQECCSWIVAVLFPPSFSLNILSKKMPPSFCLIRFFFTEFIWNRFPDLMNLLPYVINFNDFL
jgi:hypothetical protein